MKAQHEGALPPPYFGHLMRRVDSLEKTLVLGGIGDRRRRGQQRMRWLDVASGGDGVPGHGTLVLWTDVASGRKQRSPPDPEPLLSSLSR